MNNNTIYYYYYYYYPPPHTHTFWVCLSVHAYDFMEGIMSVIQLMCRYGGGAGWVNACLIL